jgi:hypothetical protein
MLICNSWITKYILEKWITDISNNDELKEIVKESVKALLSENKQVISVTFAAIIQTLKADPKLVKLIYNIPTANTGYKDNSNNITKYLEFNKDKILNLTEKHYENLIEVLINNAMEAAVVASSNPTLSSSSSSPFVDSYNQRDTYKIEDSEIYDNSKGDIAD